MVHYRLDSPQRLRSRASQEGASYLGFLGVAGGILLWPAVAVHVVLTALLVRTALNRSKDRSA